MLNDEYDNQGPIQVTLSRHGSLPLIRGQAPLMLVNLGEMALQTTYGNCTSGTCEVLFLGLKYWIIRSFNTARPSFVRLLFQSVR